MSDTKPEPSRIEAILAAKSITSDDVRAMRMDVFCDGVVSHAEAQTIFRLDQACADNAQEWSAFYVESLTDYFVWQSNPTGYLDEAGAQFLIDNLLRNGKLDGLSELELLVNIVHRATSCPEPIVVLVLEAVKDSVLDPDTALYGHGRRRGVITAGDIHLIRRSIYGKASGGGYTTTRREADILFNLNNATVAAENHEEWRDLFVRAVASFLMFPLPAPQPPTAGEVERIQEWLKERPGAGQLLRDIGNAALTHSISESWNEMDLFGTRRDAEKRAEEEAAATESFSRESIDEAEAQWLISRIDEDRVLHENERALLAFIRDESPRIDPSLHEMLARIDA